MAHKAFYGGATMTLVPHKGKAVVLTWTGTGGFIEDYKWRTQENTMDDMLNDCVEEHENRWFSWLEVWHE